MTSNTSEPSLRKVARVAGACYLIAITIVIVSNYAINFQLIIPENAKDTAKNLRSNETLFRINIACNLLYAVTIIVLMTSLFILLKGVNKNIAMIAMFCRFVYPLMWIMVALYALEGLRILNKPGYLSVIQTSHLEAMSRLRINASYDAYYVGLPFWALASSLCSYLFWKSRYIAKWLAIFGIVSSVWGVFCGFAFIIFPVFQNIVDISLFDVPLVVFEIVLGFILINKGIKPAAPPARPLVT